VLWQAVPLRRSVCIVDISGGCCNGVVVEVILALRLWWVKNISFRK